MIGYMKPQKGKFSKAERDVYQSIYCGLCRHLKYEYGVTGTFVISYEIVDLLLLIEAIIPQESKSQKMSCSLTPFIWKDMRGINERIYSEAARVSVIVAGLEIQDNIFDDNRVRDKILYTVTKAKINKAHENSESSAILLEKEYDRYMTLEKKCFREKSGFENIVNQCGCITKMIGAILTNDINIDTRGIVLSLMNIWGKWIFLMDAIEDYDSDVVHERFNPWKLSDAPTDRERYLMNLEDEANLLLEVLPLIRYESILHSLYRNQLPERRAKLFQRSFKY